MWTTFFASLAEKVAGVIWTKIEERLNKWMEAKSQIKAISDEASSLKEELKGASTDAERIQILHKIGDFSDRLGH